MNYLPKKDLRLMRFIGWFSPAFMTDFWTTIGEDCYYPTTVTDPMRSEYKNIRVHELVHTEQQHKYTKPVWFALYFFCPLPVFLAYFRWRFEREAYLVQITGTTVSNETVVNLLHNSYFYPWPKRWMLEWFNENRGP